MDILARGTNPTLERYLSPLTLHDRSTFSHFFNLHVEPTRYENSWLFVNQFLQYGGFKYLTNDTLIAFSVDHASHETITFVRPMGNNVAQKAKELAHALLQNGKYKEVVVRYLNEMEHTAFLAEGFRDRDQKLPQPICDIDEILSLKGKIWSKLRLRINRFTSHYHVKHQDLTETSIETVRSVCNTWQMMYHDRYGTDTKRPPIVEHYVWLTQIARDIVDNHRVFGFTSNINGTPQALCIGEAVSDECIAVYANLSSVLFAGLPEVIIYELAVRAKQGGYRYLNLGHSDLDSLHKFKMKFNPFNLKPAFSVKYRLDNMQQS